MQVLTSLNPAALLNTLVCLSTAFLLGGLIGFERQVRQRTAGLRTNTLVAVGAAVFVDMAFRLGGPEGAVRVVAYVVSGIGFLGAGAIMKEGANVSGLNTAATLWGSAAVGCCAGAKLLPEACARNTEPPRPRPLTSTPCSISAILTVNSPLRLINSLVPSSGSTSQ